GRFDPTGLSALEAWGYDRDWDQVRDGSPTESAGGGTAPLVGCSGIQMDSIVRSVTLGRGVRLDLGGIGKGYAADVVAQDLADAGVESGCVDLGGDLRAVGTGPYDGAWVANFDDPTAFEQVGSLRFATGAVATSTRLRRRWRRGEQELHHLLDPATGAPAQSGVASVTVVAAEAWWGEVLAKAAFVAGPRDGLELLEAQGVDGFVIRDDGVVLETASLDQFCVRPVRS
ncbi:MAG: FAD:protein FMN transferase, partial [Acidimicrobiia bacterium]|nr:FAD:protein FMN transferase [Acidimicrobiia bacterium]